MELFIRDPRAETHSVYLNGKRLDSYVFASEGMGLVATQDFPPDWQIGDPVPDEREQYGKVEVRENGQTDRKGADTFAS